MNKKALTAIVAVAMLAVASPSMAHRYQRSTSDHPLRLVAYVVHPIGMAIEYVVMRPVHWVVSRPCLDVAFGHQSAVLDDPTYFEWTHGDFTPSIAEEVYNSPEAIERRNQAKAEREAARAAREAERAEQAATRAAFEAEQAAARRAAEAEKAAAEAAAAEAEAAAEAAEEEAEAVTEEMEEAVEE